MKKYKITHWFVFLFPAVFVNVPLMILDSRSQEFHAALDLGIHICQSTGRKSFGNEAWISVQRKKEKLTVSEIWESL